MLRWGFGGTLIKMNVEQELGGWLDEIFESSGFRCELVLPLDKLIKRSPVFRMRQAAERI